MKPVSHKSVLQQVEDQVRKWQQDHREQKPESPSRPIITLSREPGSGGRLIAAGIADALGYDLFHQEVLHEMAKSARVSARLMESVDEKGLSMIEDWVASAVHQRHLWPDEYLQHLLKIVGTIARHGRAVVVGRGANFILPPANRFRVRVIAPADFRAEHVAREHNVTAAEARSRIRKTDSERQAFIRKYFHADIADPLNYDLTLNTSTISIDTAIDTVCRTVQK